MQPTAPPPFRRFSLITAGLLGASLVLLLGIVSVSAHQETPLPPAKRGTAGRLYPKLRVLRDLPQEQFAPLMNEWNEALGVECVFCHVEVKTAEGKTVVDFEKEDNPKKEIAREMYLLTRELNEKQKSIKGAATCFMCHQGHEEPITKKPAAKPNTSLPKRPVKPATKPNKKG